MSKLKYILSALLILLTGLLVMFFLSPENKQMNISEKTLLTSTAVSDNKIFFSDKKVGELKKIASSGVLEMYLDESNLCICILDTISGKLWRSLPISDTTENSANLTLDVIIKGRVYTLNSQRDSLKLDCATYEVNDGTLTISYSFRLSLENGKKIDLLIPLNLSLSDGTLRVNVECKNIVNHSTADVYIRSLGILPYFGADNQGKKGDFILLPSSSGIILDTQSPAESFNEISLPVYGEDPAKNTDVTSYVPIGAFGMKQGNNAFICLIDKGDALACIKAQKALNNGTANRVSAEFEITPTLMTDDTIYLSTEAYEGTISLSYRFLGGNNADYITMAGACRELLIRHGRLSDNAENLSDSYPFNLTLISDSAEKGQTTTRQEVQEMITSLATKGIGNIRIILESENTKNIALLSDFAKKENLSLSLKSNIYSASKNSSLTLSGAKSSLGIRSVSKKAESLIDIMRSRSLGICLADAGNILPSDYSIKGYSRSKVLSDISDICTMLSSHGSLTVSSANIYTVKFADNIINIPLVSSLEDNQYCKSVPFLQAVFHGICDYSFTAINLSSDSTKAILRSIEYGAVPHYEWYFAQATENDPYHYMNSLAEARLVYDNMKNMFSDLRDQRITSHEEVKENVMCTIYSSGSEIYVNYNDTAVSVGGITLDPMGFVRVN